MEQPLLGLQIWLAINQPQLHFLARQRSPCRFPSCDQLPLAPVSSTFRRVLRWSSPITSLRFLKAALSIEPAGCLSWHPMLSNPVKSCLLAAD
jgi:hypothetical protein